MSKLVLQELLDSVGINKITLAKLMGVSPKTVQRMGDNVNDETLAAINDYKQSMTHEQSEAVPVPVVSDITDDMPDAHQTTINTGDYDVNSLNVVNHRNIALSRIAYGRGEVPINIVAASFSLNVFTYNAAVQNTVNHCVEAGTSFKALRAQ